jgi:aromatic-L-amino-acid decarboxylase
LRHHLREHIRLAEELGARVAADPRLELVAPVSFALVSFRHRDGSDATERLADAINASGSSYVTPSLLGEERFIRVSVGQTRTEQVHVDRLWALIDGAA